MNKKERKKYSKKTNFSLFENEIVYLLKRKCLQKIGCHGIIKVSER